MNVWVRNDKGELLNLNKAFKISIIKSIDEGDHALIAYFQNNESNSNLQGIEVILVGSLARCEKAFNNISKLINHKVVNLV